MDNSLIKESGGDCREYSYEAINWALDHQSKRYIPEIPNNDVMNTLLRRSQVIVLTDAPPKGDIVRRNTLRETIITKAKRSQISIHFFLPQETFNCLQDYPDGVEEFTVMANATNGIIIDTGFNFSDFALSYRNRKSVPIRKKRAVTMEQRCHTFLVSSLSHDLTFSLKFKTRQKKIIVTKPDNSTVEFRFIYSRGSDKLALVSVAEPQAGEWRACVKEGSLEISSEMIQISMDFTALYYAQSNEQHTYLTPLQPPGCKLKFVSAL